MLNRSELFLLEISLPYIYILIYQYRDGNLASYLSTLLLCLNVDFDIFQNCESELGLKLCHKPQTFFVVLKVDEF